MTDINTNWKVMKYLYLDFDRSPEHLGQTELEMLYRWFSSKEHHIGAEIQYRERTKVK